MGIGIVQGKVHIKSASQKDVTIIVHFRLMKF